MQKISLQHLFDVNNGSSNPCVSQCNRINQGVLLSVYLFSIQVYLYSAFSRYKSLQSSFTENVIFYNIIVVAYQW